MFRNLFNSYRVTARTAASLQFRRAASNSSSRLFSALSFGAVASSGLYTVYQTAKQPIALDANTMKGPIDPAAAVAVADEKGIFSVQPPTKCPPFPSAITLLGDDSTPVPYELLGVGVRTVSFLSFHVYALGIYIAEPDKKLAHSILNFAAKQHPSGDLKQALLDPVVGVKLVSHLLDHGVRLDLRIVPVRNTDFGHLRDGFVRGVLNHPFYKELVNHPAIPKTDPAHIAVVDEMGQGVNQLKVAFSRKMSVPKFNILHLTHNPNGSLGISYYKSQTEVGAEKIDLGVVNDSNVSKIVVLHYLTGKTPASESGRISAVDGLSAL